MIKEEELKIKIGIEIHAELKTKSKLFTNSRNLFDQKINKSVNSYDIAYPGTMPVLNKKVVILALQCCKILNANINSTLSFERKHYFYPDLPKGYQITQYKNPIGKNGYLKIKIKENLEKKIYIKSIQIEEDTAQQIYEKDKIKINFNRCSIPLIEIVTKPDFENSKQVKTFLEKLQFLFFYYKISDAKMHEASLRCDLNISIKKNEIKNKRVEIKNLNSINFIVQAIDYEIKRQISLLNQNLKVKKETRFFDEAKKETILLRRKNTKIEYNYLFEANITPIHLKKIFIEKALSNLSSSPDEIKKKLINEFNLNEENIFYLLKNKFLLKLFLKFFSSWKKDAYIGINILRNLIPKEFKNKIFLFNFLKKKIIKEKINILKENLIKEKITFLQLKTIFPFLLKENVKEFDLQLKNYLNQKNKGFSKEEIKSIIENIINDDKKTKILYQKDEKKTRRFLIGNILRKNKYTNPIEIEEIISEIFEKN
jgi:aspartyl-tRNA(Asn)/glutamyl-tRNA(Gln) amidotransferase subunit B